jgi:lipopolysaccharide/colanic/teichoic acid biosynthesis glycosyltransferase
MYKLYYKRIFDVIFAGLGVLILLPLMIVIGFLIRLTMGSPIIFKQMRPGLNKRLFKLMKFRTMNNKTDKNGILLPNSQRITKLGRFLRESSLDEIPELFNILKGEMSFVGPRPLLEKYLPYYSNVENKRHEVKPGLTGLAQIKGRNKLVWEERFRNDAWYVDHISFRLDLEILLLTIKIVLKREGNKSDFNQIMIPFDEYITIKRAEKHKFN